MRYFSPQKARFIGRRTTSEHRISTFRLSHFPGRVTMVPKPTAKCLKIGVQSGFDGVMGNIYHGSYCCFRPKREVASEAKMAGDFYTAYGDASFFTYRALTSSSP